MATDPIDIFAENGFIGWGGYWNYPIDYQEIGSRKFVEQLSRLYDENFNLPRMLLRARLVSQRLYNND